MNKIVLIGNLTRDPEMRTTPNGYSVCSFGLAVNRRRKVEGQPDVDFFNVSAWRQLGENCAKYLLKGSKACVVGRVQIRTYDAQDGTKRTVVDVEADDVEFLPSPSQEARHAAGPSMPPPAQGGAAMESGFTQVDEDELPF